jgi:hypothetical protein
MFDFIRKQGIMIFIGAGLVFFYGSTLADWKAWVFIMVSGVLVSIRDGQVVKENRR